MGRLAYVFFAGHKLVAVSESVDARATGGEQAGAIAECRCLLVPKRGVGKARGPQNAVGRGLAGVARQFG